MKLTRRDLLKLSAGAGAALAVRPSSLRARSLGTRTQDLITKPIPSSGERIPVIGIGTRDYSTGASGEALGQFRGTLAAFVDHGGTVIDTSTNYGRGTSETVLGNILGEQDHIDDVFWATKVDREDRAEGITRMENSFEQLRTDHIDLMQVHNLRGTTTQLATMREWRQEGRYKYIGVTASSQRAFDRMIATIEGEELDFVQINYSLASRGAGERILPMCQDKGIATMINLPFGYGRLFQAVAGMDVPDWASEWADSWGQFFLKYVVSHPAVTVAIPGTTKPHHAADNMGAARGWMPDAAMRKRLEDFFDAI